VLRHRLLLEATAARSAVTRCGNDSTDAVRRVTGCGVAMVSTADDRAWKQEQKQRKLERSIQREHDLGAFLPFS
jgi:hypothetical protein